MRKAVIVTVAALVVLFVAAEVYLRVYWGFCDAVLVQKNEYYEYEAQPGQDRHRFRKHILYNEFSMRSEPLNSADRIRILAFGDSVINGGAQIDQDSLATTIIERTLSAKYGGHIRCLNISYGSWGPDNCYAYLMRHGDFGARMFILVVSSHDLYDSMEFTDLVDRHVTYPARQYRLAVGELADRYLLPRLLNRSDPTDHITKKGAENPGFGQLAEYARLRGIPLLVYLHPDRAELAEGKYTASGGKIIVFCEASGVPLIKGLDCETITSFRDGIHPNEEGQRRLAQTLLPAIETLLATDLAGPGSPHPAAPVSFTPAPTPASSDAAIPAAAATLQ